jgi:lipoprotein-anchoring transpeptidase ErfK/SrfK
VDGWDKSPLGRLYRPKYFNGGIAVHGYLSVPPYPASHGCVRVSVPAMDWFWKDDRMDRGTKVIVR